jgi:hypothetical protein
MAGSALDAYWGSKGSPIYNESFSTFAVSSMDTAALIAIKSIDDIAAPLFVRS